MDTILRSLIIKLLETALSEIRIVTGCQIPSKGTRLNSSKSDSSIPNKVQTDLGLLQILIEDLLKECAPNAQYKDVVTQLTAITQEYQDEYKILEHDLQNKKLLRYMQNKWKKDKEDFKDRLLKCDEKIFELDNDIREEVGVEMEMKTRLVTKWEKARLEQTQEKFQGSYSRYESALLEAQQKCCKEARIYNEIEVFTNHEIQCLTESAEKWQQRYESERCSLDEDIKLAKVQIETTQDRTQTLRDTYVQRNIEIQMYLEQKQQLQDARAREKLKWESAVKIQAWWRGTMYRNGLGPYRRKKKPKKGKAGKKK